MNNFIYCFSEKDKKRLESKGYKLFQRYKNEEKEIFIFLNAPDMVFDLKGKFVLSDNLTF